MAYVLVLGYAIRQTNKELSNPCFYYGTNHLVGLHKFYDTG